MTKVDSKGRIVLPKEVREDLGLSPGTEVEIDKENGKAVVKPEDDPEEIIDRMNQLIQETSPARKGTKPLDEGADPIAQKHKDAIERGAEESNDE